LAEIPQTREVLAKSLQSHNYDLAESALYATAKMFEGSEIKAGPFVIAIKESGIVDVLKFVLEMLQAHEDNVIVFKLKL
jgi:hypothetical protein